MGMNDAVPVPISSEKNLYLFVFAFTAIPSTVLGTTSKYPRRKTCLLVVENEALSSMDDGNCS